MESVGLIFDNSPSGIAGEALPRGTWKGIALALTRAQLALRFRKTGMSRTFSSTGLRTGAARPNGSRRCGATGRACSAIGLAGRAAGINDGGLANYCVG